ncbi:MAG: hypothetical protein V8S34_06160 [Lawsonibacter sp.]
MRCYKAAIPHEKAMEMILDGQCGAFNPLLLQCLKDVQYQVADAMRSDGAQEEPGPPGGAAHHRGAAGAGPRRTHPVPGQAAGTGTAAPGVLHRRGAGDPVRLRCRAEKRPPS